MFIAIINFKLFRILGKQNMLFRGIAGEVTENCLINGFVYMWLWGIESELMLEGL